MCRLEQIAVVIPCLNEARSIGLLVQQVRSFVPTVIVVNDGSTDQTAHDAISAGATVINHPAPRGKGVSLRAGFDRATNLGFRWALAMDGDGQHIASDIPIFLKRAESSPAAMIVGNRMAASHRMPLLRRLVNQWMSAALNTFCNTTLPDSQCGFRLVNLEAWNRLPFRSNHFEIESELIVRFAHAGFPIDFVPIQTRYASEISKIRPLRDTFRWFRWWFSIRNELAATDLSSTHARFDSRPQDATA